MPRYYQELKQISKMDKVILLMIKAMYFVCGWAGIDYHIVKGEHRNCLTGGFYAFFIECKVSLHWQNEKFLQVKHLQKKKSSSLSGMVLNTLVKIKLEIHIKLVVN